MRIRHVKISGFKSIPFRASCRDTARDRAMIVEWQEDAFQFSLPIKSRPDTSMLSAIMGANSTGKSSILFALEIFFSNMIKLNSDLFSYKDTDRPIMVEVTFEGDINEALEWHQAYCHHLQDSSYGFVLGRWWTAEGGGRYIKFADVVGGL